MRFDGLFLHAPLLVLAGCSGTPSSSGGTQTGVSSDDFVSAFVQSMCDGTAMCCGSAGFAFNRDACVTSMTREGLTLLRGTNSSRIYDPAGAARCIDESRALL